MPDPRPRIPRDRAANALAALGARGMAVLAEGARSPDPAVRRAALEAIDGSLAAPPEPLRVYGWEAPAIDHAALGTYRDAVEIAFPVLLEAVRDSDPPARAAARTALGSVALRPATTPEEATRLAVAALAGLLKDGNALERASAARALGGIGPSAALAVPALIDLLRRPDSPADGGSDLSPAEAARALGRIGAAQAIPDLLGWIREDEFKAKTAMSALGTMGVRDARVIEVLLATVQGDGYFPDAVAAQALVRLDAHLDEALLPLAAEAARGKPVPFAVMTRGGDQIGAAETLLTCPKAATTLVRRALVAEDRWTPVAAGNAIAMLLADQVAEAVALLRAETARARNDGDAAALERIAWVAAGMGPPGAHVAADLVPLLGQGGALREAVALAVVSTGEMSPAAAEGLARCLREGPPDVRAAIFREICRTPAKFHLAAAAPGAERRAPVDLTARPLADAIRELAADPNPALRADALWLLADMGVAGASAREEIEASLRDEDEGCRAAAAGAVPSVGSAVLPPRLVAALAHGPIAPETYYDLCWPEGPTSATARAAFARTVRADRFWEQHEGVYFTSAIASAQDADAALRILVPALKRSWWRGQALDAIRAMGARAAPAAAAVAAALDAGDEYAARTLVTVAPTAKETVPALVRALRRGSKSSALDALAALGPGAHDAVPAMLNLWLSYDPEYPERLWWYRRVVNAVMRIEPDGQSLTAQIPRLREALLAP